MVSKKYIVVVVLFTISLVCFTACPGPDPWKPNSLPTVTITSGPQGIIDVSTATFNWTGTDQDGSISMYYFDIDQTPPTIATALTSTTITDLSHGNHTFYLIAEDNDGDKSSIASWQFSCDVNNPPTTPNLNTITDSDNDGIIIVTWSASSDNSRYVTEYELQRDNNSNFNSPDEIYSTTQTSKTITLNNGTYYFRVRAKDNENVYSNWSNTRSITIIIEQDINVSITPQNVDFGQVLVGQYSNQNVTITNQASSDGLLYGNITISGNMFSIISGGGSYNLSPGQTRTVQIRFQPASLGTKSGTLTIIHNGSNESSPSLVSLIGVGTEENIFISISPSSLDFGEILVGEAYNQNVAITNQAGSNGSLNGVSTISGLYFSILSGGGSFSLSPGQSRTVQVRFQPSSPGVRSGTLSITHNSTNEFTPISIPLSGEGITSIVSFETFIDSYVSSELPENNFGSDPSLAISPDTFISYIGFDLSSILPGSLVVSAYLRLYPIVLEGYDYAIITRPDQGWIESVIDWNNQPGYETPWVTSTPPGPNQWWEIDVTNIVERYIMYGEENRGFRIAGTSGVITVHSRNSENSAYRPELVIDFIGM